MEGSWKNVDKAASRLTNTLDAHRYRRRHARRPQPVTRRVTILRAFVSPSANTRVYTRDVYTYKYACVYAGFIYVQIRVYIRGLYISSRNMPIMANNEFFFKKTSDNAL